MKIYISLKGKYFVWSALSADLQSPAKRSNFIWNKLVPFEWATDNVGHLAEAIRTLRIIYEQTVEIIWTDEARRKYVAEYKSKLETLKSSVSLAPASIKFDGILREPYPFQAAGIEFMVRHKRVLNADAPGLGKTIQGILTAWYAKAFPVLIVCPATLKRNWANEINMTLLGQQIHVIGAGAKRALPKANWYIINYDLLQKYKEELKAVGFKCVILDEAHYCFPAGTLITTNMGQIPIEQIVENKLALHVCSWDLSHNALQWQPITEWHKYPLYTSLVKVTHEKGFFICTADHKIWTDKGWQEANGLSKGTQLRVLQNELHNKQARHKKCTTVLRTFMRQQVHSFTASYKENETSLFQTHNRKTVRNMFKNIPRLFNPQKEHDKAILFTQLFGKMANVTTRKQGTVTPSYQKSTGKTYRDEISRTFSQNETKQSYEKSPCKRKGIHCFKRSSLSINTGWKWQITHSTAEISRPNRITNGISYYNSVCKTSLSKYPILLQSRFSRPHTQTCHRNRRHLSQFNQSKRKRQEKNIGTRISRVVSVEVYQPASNGRAGFSSQQNQFVYCLSVKHNENFFANNILVSNCKGKSSKRSQTMMEIVKALGDDIYLLGLTGTPIVNRPNELVMQLKILNRLDVFGGEWHFKINHCGMFKGRFGWNDSGATRLDELNRILRSEGIMIRRLKEDVLTELPPKRFQVIELEGYESLVEKEELAALEFEALKTELRMKAEHAKGNREDYQKVIKELRELETVSFTEIARIRRELAIAKLPVVVEHCRNFLESSDEKLVIFAHHKKVIEELQAALKDYAVVTVTGETPVARRQTLVESFQRNKGVRVFLGSTAAKEGITLTAASTVVFAELFWSPSDIEQFADRCCRIGQKNSVLVQFFVATDSIDARIAKTFVHKEGIIEKGINKPRTKITEGMTLHL